MKSVRSQPCIYKTVVEYVLTKPTILVPEFKRIMSFIYQIIYNVAMLQTKFRCKFVGVLKNAFKNYVGKVKFQVQTKQTVIY